jgi:hypothetical protein
MIKIENNFTPVRRWETREDLNSDKIYVLTTQDKDNATWDLYLRANGSCRVVRWEHSLGYPSGEPDDVIESSFMVSDLRALVDLLQDSLELADGYFDNDAWSN